MRSSADPHSNRSVFWGSMAYTLIGGAAAGTVLTLVFLPALDKVVAERGVPERIVIDNVLTREGRVAGKKRFLSIPHGIKTTVSPSGFHMQGRSDRL